MKPRYWLVFSLFIGSNISLVQAQITVDGTTNTTLTPTDNGVRIDDGDKPNGMTSLRAGNNLFHSFDEFSIPNGSSASFNNAADIENIFSRVTGGNISNINGAINVNGGANLLLINPAGIVFGENASLNIGGSFFATTADSLLFESGEFSAVNPQAAPLLTINRPIGLNFGDNAGDIINRSNFGLQTTSVDIGLIPEFTVRDSVGLQVADGETISLIGGNILLESAAGITASGGTVELGGLSEGGTVTINPDGSLVYPEGLERGNVTLKEQSRVNVTGDRGGFININAKNLELSQRSELFTGIAEDSGSATSVAGDINIDSTNSVKITGNLYDSTTESFEELIESITFARDYGVGIRNNVGLSSVRRNSDSDRSNAVGNGGDINITTTNLELSNVAVIDTSVFGTGNGGNININAEDISLTGNQNVFLSQVRGFNFARVREQGIGDGGNLNINTGSISFRDGAGILSDVQGGAIGNGGDINITATGTASFVVEENFGLALTQLGDDSVGSAGDIEITAQSIILDNFLLISSANSGSQGNGGNIILNARDEIFLKQNSSVLAQVFEGAEGNAGNIEIDAGSLSVENNILVLSSSQGIGNGGNITLNARDEILLKQNSLVLSQLLDGGEGNAGDIEIDAGSLSIEDGSFILSDTQGMGNAGNIALNIDETITLEGISEAGFSSQIVAGLSRPTSQGAGGNIEIDARELILNDTASITSNSVLDSIGSAGDIEINVDRLQVAENSLINVFTGNDEPGGAIAIDAQNIDLIKGGKILAATDSGGDGGNINLNVTGEIAIDNSVESTAPFIEVPESPLLNELQSAPSGIYADATENATGNSGNIVIGADNIPQQVILTNEGQIVASSEGAGSGGNIFIKSQNLELDGQGSISATTVFDRGGEVTLVIADSLILRDNSEISARAFAEANGGNLSIDTDLIFASPNQNNDIIANAQQGLGGNINITADSILGILERSSNPPNNTNDLDVSSDLSIDGTVTINNPDVDPTSGIIELPTVPIDAEAILAQDLCKVENENVAGGSSFIITGRGGLTPTSEESLNNINRVVEWTDVADLEVGDDDRVEVRFPEPKTTNNYRQSQGLIVAKDGSLWLTANVSKTTPQSSTVHPDCNSKTKQKHMIVGFRASTQPTFKKL